MRFVVLWSTTMENQNYLKTDDFSLIFLSGREYETSLQLTEMKEKTAYQWDSKGKKEHFEIKKDKKKKVKSGGGEWW